MKKKIAYPALGAIALTGAMMTSSCKPKGLTSRVDAGVAEQVYVAPGEYDEFYNIVSGGFNGQILVYGLPSGRLFRQIPVFSADPTSGWGYSEDTKAMLNTSFGYQPWDDQHHIALSVTNGEHDGRWIFANANNTPRVARLSFETFETEQILEIPNSSGNHSSPFITENSEYILAGTRFAYPLDDEGSNPDVPISSYKENFKGTISFVSIDPEDGDMNIAFQILMPGLDFDLSRAGKGKSGDWMFVSCYNSELAHTLLEVNASQNDKDFIAAINWRKAEEYVKAGKARTSRTKYYKNTMNHETFSATSEVKEEVLVLDATELEDLVYLMPCPKSPHGCDTDPTGSYIIGSGKLASLIPVFSFDKMIKAIEEKDFEGKFEGINVLNYDSVLHGEVQKPGLGPLHTEFDGKGFAYTTMFVSSELVKWNLETLEIVDRQPTFYSPGHMMIPGGNTTKPYGKYAVAYNKISKDRFLPTGPELGQTAQLFDISGDKMKLLLDFPTIGEPHHAEAIPAELIMPKVKRFYDIKDNKHKHVTKSEADARVERNGNRVDVYMTAIRSHLAPDNIEGIKLGDEVYFHVTNIEQDWDLPHGFAIKGGNNSEILVMPGATETLKWVPSRVGVFAFYCTDFCSALHQEMQGYARVSPADSDVELRFGVGDTAPK